MLNDILKEKIETQLTFKEQKIVYEEGKVMAQSKTENGTIIKNELLRENDLINKLADIDIGIHKVTIKFKAYQDMVVIGTLESKVEFLITYLVKDYYSNLEKKIEELNQEKEEVTALIKEVDELKEVKE